MKQRLLNSFIFAVIGSVIGLAAIIPSIANAQSVTIGTIPASSFCSGDPISVSFTATGFWQHKNAFTLQLSDAAGNFTNGFSNLGSIQDTLPGTFTITTAIPGNIVSSARYRFRIMGALPYMTSADNGSDIAIGQVAQPSIYFPDTDVAVETSFGIFSQGAVSDTFYWDFGSGAMPATDAGVGHFSDSIVYSTGGQKTITLREVSAGGCSATVTATLRVFDCSPPAIPHDAVVINNDTVVSGGELRN